MQTMTRIHPLFSAHDQGWLSMAVRHCYCAVLAWLARR